MWTVTVPGTVAGWAAMRERFGTKPFSELLAPAIYYAENGVPINPVTAGLWSAGEKRLASQPNAKATYLIGGERAPRFGEVWTNPDLAASLRRIAEHGRDGSFQGPTAQAIVDTIHEYGGVMTLEDLADFQPEWVDPISTTYRGWTVYEIPPNTQGIAALMMLNLMEQFPMSEYGFHSAKSLHTMIEAKKLAYADMLQYVRRRPEILDDSSGAIAQQAARRATGEADRGPGELQRACGQNSRVYRHEGQRHDLHDGN